MRIEIRKYGDDVLRDKAQPIAQVNDEIRALAGDMIETMHLEQGIGLAAEQVGRPIALCVVDLPAEYDQDENQVRQNPDIKMPLVLINPEITEFSKEKEVREEGCLSFPGIYVPVERSVDIKVRFQDLSGQTRQLSVKRFLARVVQHEVDHLNGVLLVDRMSAIKKIALSGQLRRLKHETRDALGVA
jgi:peptide deformylase